MNTYDDQTLDRTLRSLDAADTDLDETARRRGDALLNRILADSDPARPSIAPMTPRRSRRRWLIVPAAAAALALAFAVRPETGGSPAYAAWTPDPMPVASPARERAIEACRAQFDEAARTLPEAGPEQPMPQADTARVQIAEQRGPNVFVALMTDNESTMTCLSDIARPGRVLASGGGIATESTPPPAPLAPDGLRSLGHGLQTDDGEGYAHTQGRVGTDVRSVTIHSEGLTFEATLSDGTFAAWWPVAIPASELTIIDVVYDVTLTDGRVLTSVDDGLGLGRRPGPREIGRIERGGGTGPEGEVSTVGGLIGREVAGVTVHADGRDIETTIRHSTFSAQWTRQQDAPDPAATPVSYTLTLVDGTILRDVRPVSGTAS